MTHDDRAAKALDIPNPGKALLGLERAGLVVVDAATYMIDRSELELAVEALAEIPREALGPLGRVAVASPAHQALREAHRRSQCRGWLEDIARAKGAA